MDRAVILAASTALAIVVAGCTSPPLSEPAQNSSASNATIAVTVQNQDSRSRSGSIQVIHTQHPTCLYSDPACRMPSIPNTLADTRFNLSPGESRTVHTVEVPLEGQEVEEDRYIDTYTVQVSTAAVQEELSGLEAGAESIVGRDDAASYRWRVTGGRHQIAAVLDPDGITMEVSSTP